MKKISVLVAAIIAVTVSFSCLKYTYAYNTSDVPEIDPEGYFDFPTEIESSEGEILIKVTSDKLDNESGEKTIYSQFIGIDSSTYNNIKGATTYAAKAQYVPAFDNESWDIVDGDSVGLVLRMFPMGQSFHILWVKLVLDGNTYYDYLPFTLNKDTSTPSLIVDDPAYIPIDNPNQNNNGGTSSGNQSSSSTLKIVDGDGAELNASSKAYAAYLKVDGITFDSSKDYYVATAHTSTVPTYNQSSMSKVNKTSKLADIFGIVEEAGDIYVWVYAVDPSLVSPEAPVKVVNGAKVARPEYPGYGNRIKYDGLSKGVNINVPRKTDGATTYRSRNISVKIGRVTDSKILKKIKNKDASGMSELMAYAKSSTPEVSKSITSTGVSAHENQVDLSSFTDVKGGYYYAYAIMDDGNGNYYPVEDINLLYSIGNKILVDETSDSFKWDLGDDDTGSSTDSGKKDGTVSNKYLSNTGEKAGIIAFIAIAAVGVFVYRRKVSKK